MNDKSLLSIKPLRSAQVRLKGWLLGRGARERVLILMAFFTLGLWLLWAILLIPIEQWKDDAQRETGAWERRLSWLETQPRSETRSELRPSVLTTSIGNCGLQLLRVNQESEAILVTLQEQSFECVLDWLIRVETGHGIQVEQLRLQAGQRAGSVSGTLRFRGG